MHDIEDEMYEGGWRCLCAGVLLHAVTRMASDRKMHPMGSKYKTEGSGGLDKELLRQKSNAKDWISGGVGLVTFEDCCDSLGVDPDITRQKIEDYCGSRRSRAVFK